MRSQSFKPRVCACGCQQVFTPARGLQRVKDWECAKRYAEQKRAKEEERQSRREMMIRRKQVKPLSHWKARAQAEFNAYIRERDKDATCISCGRWHDGQWHAGHFLSVGSHPELRFNEDNCHKQCSPCNAHKSGNIAEYRPRLIAKIGLERVEWLEGAHEAAHYTREDCQRIEAEYKAKLKCLRMSEK